MNENQRKWLLGLQSKGIKFENVSVNGKTWYKGPWEFKNDPKDYRIPAQPIPDIPDWRELCRGMHSKGVQFECFEKNWRMMEELSFFDCRGKNLYRIPQQPLPEWREETIEVSTGIASSEYKEAQQHKNEQSMAILESVGKMTEEKIFSNLRITDAELLEKIDQYMKDNPDSVVPVDEAQIARITELVKDVKIDEETKPDQKEGILHHELQVQWHEDKLHSLRTREPMREWEYRLKNGDGEWRICHDPHFSEKYEYRRKPRTVKYWHCVVNYVCDYGTGAENVSLWSTCSKDELESEIKNIKDDDTTAKFSPIIETTVEMED